MTIIHGDCLEVMAGMEPESVDAIVCDPPYDLGEPRSGASGYAPRTEEQKARRGFMGKQWDGTGIAFRRETWEAAYRVAKPSAYLLAFGGTRTVHRMTVALEDAGWIIRDMLVWGYASGFPKSKASLKPAWEPIVMARKPGPLRMLAIDECRIPGAPPSVPQPSFGTGHIYGMKTGEGRNGEMSEASGRWPANIVLTDPIFDGGVEGVVGGGEVDATRSVRVRAGSVIGNGNTHGAFVSDRDSVGGYDDSGTYSRFFLIAKSSRADREPVLDEYAYRLHRERGECDKLGAWESADRSRSEQTATTSPARATSEATSTDDSSSDTSSPGSLPTDPSLTDTRSTISTATSRTTTSPISSSSIPSPTSDSTPGASSETASGGSHAESADSSSLWGSPTGISVVRAGRSTDDAGPATSGSSSSRNACGRCGKPLPRFSTHPTQKPTELMRHLVRLVTPVGGHVLDPFGGSGTTALAAEREGFRWTLIERELEYVRIAEARLNGTQRGLGLESA